MTQGYADLHTHTRASDGTGTPADNVRIAREAGLAAVAITDHDTVAGLEEAMAEGRRLGMAVVPGVEISTVADGKDIHVLGYFMAVDDELFLERLKELRSIRDKRNMMMIERLNELGMEITMAEVTSRFHVSGRTDDTVGRPHIADVLIAKGYASSLRDAFDRYLGEGGAAYVNPPRIRPETAIQWIHEAGGAAVLAHPGLYKQDDLVAEMAGDGLDGIEADHSDHSPEEVEHYRRMAEQAGLLVTAGSDYHGERNGTVFHGPLGSRRIGMEVVRALETKAASYKTIRNV